MGKKSRRVKSTPTQRTMEQRQSEIDTLRDKLDSLGLGPETVPEIKTFFETTVKDFILHGAPHSGSFPLQGFKRVMEYTLSNRLAIEVSFNLRYKEDV